MVAPTLRVVPEDAVYSDYELACDLGADYGLPTDEWQRELIKDILSERDNGLYCAPVFGFSLPRRNGKSHAVAVMALYFMTVLERKVVYTAHRTQSAKELWAVMKRLFEETELSAHVKSISNIAGHESIYLTEGGSFRLFSRSEGKGSGRGSAADVLFLDEAYSLPASTLADLLPMVSNAENPLTVYLGSPSYEDTEGQAFKRIREQTITRHNPRGGWVEWAAPAGADPYSPEVWRMTNPAMSSGRITEETMQNSVYSGMDRRQLLVELLGSWEVEHRPLIVDMEHWNAMTDQTSYIDPGAELVLAADASNDGSSAALVVCGLRSDGRKHVELLENLSGIAWTEEKIKAICKAQPIKTVLIDAKASLAYMAEDLIKEGVPLVLTNHEFIANASVNFVQSTEAHAFNHLGDGRLARSITEAALRPLLGRYAFTKAEPSSDISPLVAMAMALYGLSSEAINAKVKKQRTNAVFVGGKLYTRSS